MRPTRVAEYAGVISEMSRGMEPGQAQDLPLQIILFGHRAVS